MVLTFTAERTRARKLQQPLIHTVSMEPMPTLTRQYTQIISILEIDNANRACLHTNGRARHLLAASGRRGCGARRDGLWTTHRTSYNASTIGSVDEPDSCTCTTLQLRGAARARHLQAFCLEISSLLFRVVAPIGWRSAEFDDGEGIKDCACEAASTGLRCAAGSMDIRISAARSVSLRVADGTNGAAQDDNTEENRHTSCNGIQDNPG